MELIERSFWNKDHSISNKTIIDRILCFLAVMRDCIAAILCSTKRTVNRIVYHIRQLKSGDTVVIRNYFDTLVYKVISYKEIGETETNDLYIEKDRDLLTLITCTRMGKARYEVICERVY